MNFKDLIFGETKERIGKKSEIYEIEKKDLLRALGFKKEEVTFISYDYKTGILTIKRNESFK